MKRAPDRGAAEGSGSFSVAANTETFSPPPKKPQRKTLLARRQLEAIAFNSGKLRSANDRVELRRRR